MRMIFTIGRGPLKDIMRIYLQQGILKSACIYIGKPQSIEKAVRWG